MNIFNIFKIREIYKKYSTVAYNNSRVFIEITNGEQISIKTHDGIPATAEEIEQILNFAIKDVTKNVKTEFGF